MQLRYEAAGMIYTITVDGLGETFRTGSARVAKNEKSSCQN